MIREAASIILLRRAEAGFEVFFVRRNRGSSFMASAYVFPGGAAEEGEDARTAGARELFEEAGILLSKKTTNYATRNSSTLLFSDQGDMRKRILGGARAKDVLDMAGLEWATDPLVPWSHWITPSIEPKRFSARFFVVELPAGQEPSYDESETVDQLWISPADALKRAGELQLPPPQVRTCWELAEQSSIRAVMTAGRARGEEPHPIMPRLAPGDQPALLLPWDPEYMTKGTGESTPLTYQPSWARGPSRFVRDGNAWSHIEAPAT